MSFEKDGLRTELGGRPQRHGGVHAKLAGFVTRGGADAALVALAADYNGLAFERWVVEFFHGDEEGVHVDVEDGAHVCILSLSGKKSQT